MAVWNVEPNMVQYAGTNISGYVSHRFSMEYNTESNSFLEYTLVVRVTDTPSTTAFSNAVAVLPSSISATLNQEVAIRPHTREIRPVSGDTITMALGTITYGTTELTSADVAGEDQL